MIAFTSIQPNSLKRVYAVTKRYETVVSEYIPHLLLYMKNSGRSSRPPTIVKQHEAKGFSNFVQLHGIPEVEESHVSVQIP